MNLILLVGIIVTGNPSAGVDDGPAVQVAMRECSSVSCSKFQYGSGMITYRKPNGEYVIITNRHNLEMARSNPRATKTVYVLINGTWIVAKEGGKSSKVDLALITIQYAGQLGVMPIGKVAPTEGSNVDIYSFRRRGRLLHQRAKISGLSVSGGNLEFSDYLTADIWDGQSGGGVVQNGKLVALVYARDQKPRGFRGLVQGYKYTKMGVCVDHASLKEFVIAQGYKFPASGEWKGAAGAPAKTDQPVAETKPKPYRRSKPAKPATVTIAPANPQGTTSAAPVVSKPNGHITEINDKISKLTELVTGFATVDKPKSSSSFLKRAVVFAGTTAGLSVAGASGVGTAAMVALWLYRRRKKRKGKPAFDVSRLIPFNRGKQRFQHGVFDTYVEPLLVPLANDTKCTIKADPPPIKAVPIIVESPPTVNVQTENVYVPVERDSYREAVKYAHRKLVSRYPSAEGSIAFIDGMVDRYLAGLNLKG